jgi:hypothetical protein
MLLQVRARIERRDATRLRENTAGTREGEVSADGKTWILRFGRMLVLTAEKPPHA